MAVNEFFGCGVDLFRAQWWSFKYRPMAKLELSLPLLLPDNPSSQDVCVAQLQGALASKAGIIAAHITEVEGRSLLCLRYNPTVVSLSEVERLAKITGADVAARYEHGIFPLTQRLSEDAFIAIQDRVIRVPGVVSASVNTSARLLRVEWDRSLLDRAGLETALASLRVTTAPRWGLREVMPRWRRTQEAVLSLGAGAALMGGVFIDYFLEAPKVWVFTLYLGSYLLGSFELLRSAFQNIKAGRFSLDIDFLMLLAALGAVLLGAWAEGALLLFLF
jgi:Cd2+/Zn2+-exporting ATPase